MNKRGLTLIEIVVVVALMLTLSSIAILSYRQYVSSSYQLEAKNNLAYVRQLQKSFESSELRFEPDLNNSELGFVLEGRLRYNVGVPEWVGWTPGTNEHLSIYSSSTKSLCAPDPVCDTDNDGRDNITANTVCCMDNTDIHSSLANVECFGPTTGIGGSNLNSEVGCNFTSDELQSESTGNNRNFHYFAVGCVSYDIESVADLDVWSITDKGILSHHRDATQGNTLCN